MSPFYLLPTNSFLHFLFFLKFLVSSLPSCKILLPLRNRFSTFSLSRTHKPFTSDPSLSFTGTSRVTTDLSLRCRPLNFLDSRILSTVIWKQSLSIDWPRHTSSNRHPGLESNGPLGKVIKWGYLDRQTKTCKLCNVNSYQTPRNNPIYISKVIKKIYDFWGSINSHGPTLGFPILPSSRLQTSGESFKDLRALSSLQDLIPSTPKTFHPCPYSTRHPLYLS